MYNKDTIKNLNYVWIKINTEGDYTLYKKRYYYNSLITSPDAYYIDKRTNKNVGNVVHLFIYSFDEYGNDLPETAWICDYKKHYEWVMDV